MNDNTMRHKVAGELTSIAGLLAGRGKVAASYRSWERKVLKMFEDDYGLGKRDIDEDTLKDGFDSGDKPDEFVEWYADKYDLEAIDSYSLDSTGWR